MLTLSCLGTVALVLSLVPGVIDGDVVEIHLFKMTPTIWMDLRVDAMGLLFGITVAVLWLLAVVYSTGYMADEHRQNRYYVFLMLALGWTLGISFAGNLFTLLVFYELFSILTYPLVVHEETKEALAAGAKYIVYILIGGGLVVLAVMSTYYLGGSGSFAEHGVLGADVTRATLIAVFWCFVAGFGVKAALFPLHGWVPDAHPAAPAPFSAVLSGVMVAAGSFGILRAFFHIFGVGLLQDVGMTPYVGYVATLTVLVAAVLAVPQDDLKRRLAYSTISQMGYVILGASLLGIEALAGALVHITNHAFMKGTLFLCAGILIKRAGIHKVSEMAGIARRYPLTMGAFTVAALAMIGTPPLSGFISKWFLGTGMLEVEQPLYLIVLLGGALMAAAYLLPIVYTAYFKGPRASAELAPGEPREREAPWSMLGPTLAGAAITVLLGVLAWLNGMPLSLARLAAETLL
jgi:multicomponent Na+:H+ antiporter subunit D